MKTLVFGAGTCGENYVAYTLAKEVHKQIIGFVDNSKCLQGLQLLFKGQPYTVFAVDEIQNMEFDEIVITNESIFQVNDIRKQIRALAVSENKIHTLTEDERLQIDEWTKNQNVYNEKTDSRVGWLNSFAKYIRGINLAGNVAECGVFRGDFAYYINKYFKDRTLYLFDTFEGFDDDDVDIELTLGNPTYNNSLFAQKKVFSDTNEEMVKHRMLCPDKCIIKKGYFPDTTTGIHEQFCFVNLDMDLYTPMLAALEYFYPCMVKGGVMLLHDYFHPELPGVKQAVEDYEAKTSQQLVKMPIGDDCSLGIIKI